MLYSHETLILSKMATWLNQGSLYFGKTLGARVCDDKEALWRKPPQRPPSDLTPWAGDL
jgi:hypothetical protein